MGKAVHFPQNVRECVLFEMLAKFSEFKPRLLLDSKSIVIVAVGTLNCSASKDKRIFKFHSRHPCRAIYVVADAFQDQRWIYTGGIWPSSLEMGALRLER